MVQLRIADMEAAAELTSTSASGLAILHLDDAPDGMETALARTMGSNPRVHLVNAGNAAARGIDVNLIWFATCATHGEAAQRLEVIVDGSESPDWDEFLAGTGRS